MAAPTSCPHTSEHSPDIRPGRRADRRGCRPFARRSGMSARRAGQHARQMTRRLAARVLAAIVTLVAVGAAVGLLFEFDGLPFAVAEIAAIAGLFALDRLALPIVDRWDRGADGDEHVGAGALQEPPAGVSTTRYPKAAPAVKSAGARMSSGRTARRSAEGWPARRTPTPEQAGTAVQAVIQR